VLYINPDQYGAFNFNGINTEAVAAPCVDEQFAIQKMELKKHKSSAFIPVFCLKSVIKLKSPLKKPSQFSFAHVDHVAVREKICLPEPAGACAIRAKADMNFSTGLRRSQIKPTLLELRIAARTRINL
jgi:hypothetical protein